MAPGGFVDHASSLFSSKTGVCFGMHFTLNAEWDKVKWGPVSSEARDTWMTDEKGCFLPDPRLFPEEPPDLGIVAKELGAQLDKLHNAGFKISYVDSHMMPEIRVRGLDGIIEEFAKKKGLIDHMRYYRFPPGMFEAAKDKKFLRMLARIPEGQYFFVTHPAFYSEEMLQAGNSEVSGHDVAKGRDAEAKLFSFPAIKPVMRALFRIRPLRYDEAEPLPRMSPAEAAAILGVSE
jgi:predicted glycoside hydrolase/deacetylase ChbG (UPF0249 family)